MAIEPFPDLLEASRRHRDEHGCGAYPYDKGGLLSVLAGAVQPGRIVEVGTAVGYTSVCLADAAPRAVIDTIDFDPDHHAIAAAHFEAHGVADRVTTHTGAAEEVLPGLDAGAYELAFFDGFAPTAEIVAALHRVLGANGLLVCANLTLGGDGVLSLDDETAWSTHHLGETALAVKRA